MAKERLRYSIPYINCYALWLNTQIQAGVWLWLSWPWWMALGLLLVPFMPGLWLPYWLLALGVLGGLWYLNPKIRNLSSAAILLVLGAIWSTLWGQNALDRSLPEALIKQDVWANGTVQDLPRPQAMALRFRFNIESLEYESRSYTYSGDVQLNWYKPFPELKPGQRWRLKLRLKPASGSLNPGGFNYEQWLFSQGVRATGYVREAQSAVLLEKSDPAHLFNQLRGRIEHFINAQELKYSGLLNALAVGVRTGISEDQWQVFRDTGTAHLIAISGLHIGMVAAIAYFLGQWLWRHSLLVYTQYPAQKVARIFAILAAVAYAALAGFALPTLRALLMLLAYFLLQYLRRNPGTLFSLGLVLLVVLVFDPLAPLGSGLWLSFSAVAAIALVVRDGSNSNQGADRVALSYGEKIRRWFRAWWRVQWAVFIGLLPLTLFFFQQVSLVSLLANFVAIPVIASLVVPLVLLALVCLFIGLPALSAQIFILADSLLGWLWVPLECLSGLPFSIWRPAMPAVWAVLCCAIGTVILLRARFGKARFVGALGFLSLFMFYKAPIEEGAFRMHVLDVGQGLSVVVETRQHSLLYDAGVKYRSGFDMGDAVINPFLRQQNITNLAAVVASHDNLDHVGGMPSVLAKHPVAKRYSSAGFYAASEPCAGGSGWLWDSVRFSFLLPEPGNLGTDNNDSCVLKIESNFGSALLTGDIEREAEDALLNVALDQIRGVDVLLVPHHGSRTSSTENFIQTIHPDLAVVSAGYLNRFKHPHPQVVKRYAAHKIPLLNTASSGWISIDFDQQGVNATAWRSVYKRYWLRLKN